jgi:hypothetical protein
MLLNFTKPLVKSLRLIVQRKLICEEIIRISEEAIVDSDLVYLI